MHRRRLRWMIGLLLLLLLLLSLSLSLSLSLLGRPASPPPTPSFEGFAEAPSSLGVVAWEPVGDIASAPRPLLDLALRRIAATRGDDVRAASPPTVEVHGAWRERLRAPDVGDSSSDRWHRWTATACFYRVGAATGACERMDVRARTAWASGAPPTEWPIQVASSAPVVGGPAPTTASLIL